MEEEGEEALFVRGELELFLQKHSLAAELSQIDEVLIEYMVGVLSDLEQHAPVPDAVAMGTGRGHAPENSDADAVVAEVLVCFMEMMGAYLTGFSQLDSTEVYHWLLCLSSSLSSLKKQRDTGTSQETDRAMEKTVEGEKGGFGREVEGREGREGGERRWKVRMNERDMEREKEGSGEREEEGKEGADERRKKQDRVAVMKGKGRKEEEEEEEAEQKGRKGGERGKGRGKGREEKGERGVQPIGSHKPEKGKRKERNETPPTSSSHEPKEQEASDADSQTQQLRLDHAHHHSFQLSLDVLREIFPDRPVRELRSMLVEQCKGDLELCIQTLLDDTREAGPCPPLLPTLKERRLTDKSKGELNWKNGILEKYAFVDIEGDKTTHRPCAPKQEKKKMVRYRDNCVVSTKGERFTMEGRRKGRGGREEEEEKKEKMKGTYTNIRPLRNYRFH